MDLKIKNNYSGFTLKRVEKIDEIESMGYFFEHEKSGAELLYLKNSDDNKVFMTAFKTPPPSDNGVPHILEHCVLAGSEKFTTKDPFNDLAKSSLQTFLNAMTYPDKTVYPVASRNFKDFENLMDVYLDAVFFPSIYKIEEIFLQEGWHYDIKDKDDPLKYNGVVYNEMMGAFSSPDTTLYDSISRELFKDNQYSNNSGGVPSSIPTLSYKDFLNFHKTYYHPSNSKIYIYGNGNILEHLEFIDKNYLSRFEKAKINANIPLQVWNSKPVDAVYNYSVDKGTNLKNKDYLSYTFVTPLIDDPKECLAFIVLQEALTDSDSSPIKKELLKNGLGKDIFGFYEWEIQQPIFTIVSKFGSLENKEKFISTIFNTLENIVKNGFDKKLLEASLTSKEFELREGSQYGGEPKGLNYGLKALNTWIHDKDPFIHLRYKEAIDQLYEDIKTGYFESLISKYLLNNSHRGFVAITPKENLSEDRAIELEKYLQEVKSKMSNEEIEALVNKKLKLLERQNREDSEEDIDKIPTIELKDIPQEPEDTTPKVEETEYGKYLTFENNCSGISYISHSFDISDLSLEEIQFASILSKLLGSIDTKNYDYSSLTNQINSVTGDFNLSIKTIQSVKESESYTVRFEIKSKVLEKNIENYKKVLDEIIFNTKFDNIDRVKEVLGEAISELDDKIKGGGYAEVLRNLSNISEIHFIGENVRGISFLKILSHKLENYDEKDSLKLKNLMSKIFTSENLIISVSSDKGILDKNRDKFISLGKNYPKRDKGKVYYVKVPKKDEAFIIPSDVQYNVVGSNMRENNIIHRGSLYVAETILSLEHLMNMVRLQGGAYGVRGTFDRTGICYMSSYRDPNIDSTFKAFSDSVEYLKNLQLEPKQLKRYIIGTISSLDFPFPPEMKLDIEDIKKFGEELSTLLGNSVKTVLGSESKIDGAKIKLDNKGKIV